MKNTLKANLTDYILRSEIPVTITLLEAAETMGWQGEVVPQRLLDEISTYFGSAQTEATLSSLRKFGIFDKDKLSLTSESKPVVSRILDELLGSMAIENLGINAEEFVNQFLNYLRETDFEIGQMPPSAAGGVMLQWNDKKTCIRLAFSPICMSAAADYFSKVECCLLAIGPFATQDWENIYPYFNYYEYRDWVALYDPWSCRKLNISKGEFSGLLDWFFRDQFQKRFHVPETFPDAIHDMGLLKYDDEY